MTLPGKTASSSAALAEPGEPARRAAAACPRRTSELGHTGGEHHLAVGGHPARHDRLVDLGLDRGGRDRRRGGNAPSDETLARRDAAVLVVEADPRSERERSAGGLDLPEPHPFVRRAGLHRLWALT